MTPLVFWLVSALATWTPIHHHLYLRESREVTERRYVEVATAIATAAAEAPLFEEDPPSLKYGSADESYLYQADEGVAWTALLLAVTADAESALRADVVECRRAGDGGRGPAWSAFGLARPRAEVCGDLLAAARAAREALRTSLSACPGHEPLAFYLSGRCDRGRREARRRWRRAVAWLSTWPWAWDDTSEKPRQDDGSQKNGGRVEGGEDRNDRRNILNTHDLLTFESGV